MHKCEICGKEAKSRAGLASHKRLTHPAPTIVASTIAPMPAIVPETANNEANMVRIAPGIYTPTTPSRLTEKVRFVSKSKGLCIVVKPVFTNAINLPGGLITTQKSEGKKAHFIDGVFETDDPEIIHYLQNVYSKLATSRRYPIFWKEKIQEINERAANSSS